jgi:hypothetical protein
LVDQEDSHAHHLHHVAINEHHHQARHHLGGVNGEHRRRKGTVASHQDRCRVHEDHLAVS